MPPKKTAPPNLETLNATADTLRTAETPSVSDFELILLGAKGDIPVRQLAVQYIPRFASKFPELTDKAIDTLITLCGDDDATIRKYAIRGIKDLPYSEKVAVALFDALGDPDKFVCEVAEQAVAQQFNNPDFQSKFYEKLGSRDPQAQAKMVSIIKENTKFTEETVDQLITLIKGAFSSATLQGLDLMEKNLKLLKEEQRDELASELIDRLDTSLGTNFTEVCDNLLETIFARSRTLGENASKRLVGILSEKVLPRFDELSPSVKIAVTKKVFSLSKFTETPDILKALYENVFLHFPTAESENKKANAAVVEACLAAIYRLFTRFHTAAVEIIGIPIVRTGQPSELEGHEPDEEKQKQFRDRLSFLYEYGTAFVIGQKTRKDSIRQDRSLSELEKRDNLRIASTGIQMGNNIKHYSQILAENNPIGKRPPERLSWQKESKIRPKRPFRPQQRRHSGNRW